MAQTAQQNIPKDKFLVIAVNLLHRQFIAGGRTASKRLYREVYDGRVVPVTAVKMEDGATVRFRCSLDHSEFEGHLNFSAFRTSLSTLLGNLARALQERREVTVFSVEQRPQSVMFGITGVTVEDSKPNVMVLGADTDVQGGGVTLKLMYLDPAQFAPGEASTVAGSGSTAAR